MDERFLQHRLRSSSAGGIAGDALAIELFGDRFSVDSRRSWDLLSVAATAVGIKVALEIWCRLSN